MHCSLHCLHVIVKICGSLSLSIIVRCGGTMYPSLQNALTVLVALMVLCLVAKQNHGVLTMVVTHRYLSPAHPCCEQPSSRSSPLGDQSCPCRCSTEVTARNEVKELRFVSTLHTLFGQKNDALSARMPFSCETRPLSS